MAAWNLFCSFHVGCQNQDPETYRNALRLCKDAEKVAIQIGYSTKLIDIGGGFEGYKGQEGNFRKVLEPPQKNKHPKFKYNNNVKIVYHQLNKFLFPDLKNYA